MVHLLGGHFGSISYYLIWDYSNCDGSHPGLDVCPEHEEYELTRYLLF